jgi:hypothetical protein
MVGLLLGPKVSRYVLTDQPYVAKLVEQNLEENRDILSSRPGNNTQGSRTRTRKTKGVDSVPASLTFRSLDWETDTVDPSLTGSDDVKSFDAIIACDCIYNEALIEPFVQTCADLCKLRADDTPCLCIVGQQLRDSDVFEAFLNRFGRDFDVWRVPDSRLVEGLRAESGFAVHVGILKGGVGDGVV